MAAANTFLAFIAGVLSVLSPCVLPILPIVLGAAASKHKLGPMALAAGLSISFVIVGLFVATIGYSLGISGDTFRYIAAVLILTFGVILLLPSLQARLAVASGPIAAWAGQRFGDNRGDGLSCQFGIGVLLGAVWSPCVGPTLGAATLLAAQGRDLPQVGMTMFAFGLGAATPLLALGIVSREVMMRWRNQIMAASHGAKVALGVLFIVIGFFVLLDVDKKIETLLVDASPRWLTDLTTRF
ncbi:MAG: cytochrome c biogenesis protein CcdA [Pseudolabrys sp.]|nr:cytochrome c biogenesis protein CcdA [Pseudolabrys sp.]